MTEQYRSAGMIKRAGIRAAAPDAQETISCGMPTFALHGNLVHFAVYQNHSGFYLTPSAWISMYPKSSPAKAWKSGANHLFDGF